MISAAAASGAPRDSNTRARRTLSAEGRRLNVVSVPCLEIFQKQDAGYRERLFPRGTPVATVEAGRAEPWTLLSGPAGLNIGRGVCGGPRAADPSSHVQAGSC